MTTLTPVRRHEILEVEGLRVNLASRRVTLDGSPVVLSRMHYALLVVLARDPYRVFTKTQLYRAVWGYVPSRSRTLGQHAARLRWALNGRFVVTHLRVGYSLLQDQP